MTAARDDTARHAQIDVMAGEMAAHRRAFPHADRVTDAELADAALSALEAAGFVVVPADNDDARAIAAARALHAPTEYAFDSSGRTTEDDAPFCGQCQEYDEMEDEWRPASWPCPTVFALDAAQGEQ